MPVSYTHLDVYKRQSLERAAADGNRVQLHAVPMGARSLRPSGSAAGLSKAQAQMVAAGGVRSGMYMGRQYGTAVRTDALFTGRIYGVCSQNKVRQAALCGLVRGAVCSGTGGAPALLGKWRPCRKGGGNVVW